MADKGRRRSSRSSSLGEAIIELVALMPWWAGVALALLSYLWLHSVATTPVAVATQPGQMDASLQGVFWQTLARFGQYLLPLLALVGAGISAWRRRERRQLAADVAASTAAADVLDGLSWQRFELLVGEAFRLRGYRVLETGGGGADGGVDLMLSKGGEKFLVQCKQWRARKVGVDVVRELYGVMAARGATGGFVVCSGRFTRDAQAFAQGRQVQLIDGPQLGAMIKQAMTSSPSATLAVVPPAPPSPAAAQHVPSPAPSNAATPACPRCARPMQRRLARQGAHAGRIFWGCSAYPDCRGTRSAD